MEDKLNNAPSAGDSGEPSYTTPAGFPICSVCGRSTRSRNRLVCRPCETGTRLPLTRADRKWLRRLGIKPESAARNLPPENLTQEQLTQALLETIKRMPPEEKAKLRQAVDQQLAPRDFVIEWMKEDKIPLTKENYLHIAYMGQETPEGAEEDLPPEIQAQEEE